MNARRRFRRKSESTETGRWSSAIPFRQNKGGCTWPTHDDDKGNPRHLARPGSSAYVTWPGTRRTPRSGRTFRPRLVRVWSSRRPRRCTEFHFCEMRPFPSEKLVQENGRLLLFMCCEVGYARFSVCCVILSVWL